MKKEKVLATEKVQDLTIVLNGGSFEMKGATIPVKWFFSKELALKEPTHILLVDLTEVESRENINYAGRRYLVEVEKAVKFLQVFKSGKHTMIALAFDDLTKALSFLTREKENVNFYAEEIPVSLVANNLLATIEKYRGAVLASTMVEFTVPKELFAQKPESKIAKLCFSYLYWPNCPKPKDQCQVKKIALFYALPKLPLFILANVLYAIYLPIASLILLFFGWQSIGLGEIFQRVLKPVINGYTSDVYAIGESGTEARGIYKNGSYTGNNTWFSPFHLTGFFGFLALLLGSFTGFSAYPLFPGAAVIFMIGVLIFLFLILQRFFDADNTAVVLAIFWSLYAFVTGVICLFFREWLPEIKDISYYYFVYSVETLIGSIVLFFLLKGIILRSRWYKDASWKKLLSRMQRKNSTYANYLLENFTAPEKEVDLKYLPDTFETNKLKRDLTIRFWSAKADVCKPYES